MKIPYLSTPDKPLISTTQDFVPIADITEDVVLLKDGGAALVMESSSLNFGLLSEKEQQAVIAAYAGLLNSINYHVQILVRSQKKDISSYMNYLREAEKNIKDPKLANLMQDYQNFIVEAIKKKNVLSKSFYVVIPFTKFELGIAKSFISNLLPKKGVSQRLPYTKSYVIRKAKIALLPKRDHLAHQARRLGLKLRQLETQELIKLFYNVYNPEPPADATKKLEKQGD